MKIFAKLKQAVSALSAAYRKELFAVSVIQPFYFFKSCFQKGPLRIGALVFYRIKYESKEIVFEKKNYIKQMQTIHTKLGHLILKCQRNYILIKNIGNTHQVNEILIEIQMYKKLKKSIS